MSSVCPSLDLETFSLPSGSRFSMVKVKGGEFNFKGRKIEIKDFWIGQNLVSQLLWKEIIGFNISRNRGNSRPMEWISFEEIKEFFTKLNLIVGKELDIEFRLPIESEWEYAASSGKYARNTIFSGGKDMQKLGWYRGNSLWQSQPIGLKLPNELGIFDMSGNVREWCENKELSPVSSGQMHIIKGGAWDNFDPDCEVSFCSFAASNNRDNNLGFRIAI